jgi:hypothetical protein
VAAVATAGAAFAASGVAAKDRAATPDNRVAAIRDLMFNMGLSLTKRQSL